MRCVEEQNLNFLRRRCRGPNQFIELEDPTTVEANPNFRVLVGNGH